MLRRWLIKWKWSSRAWKIGAGIYEDMEKRRHPDGSRYSAEEKARDWHLKAQRVFVGQLGKAPRNCILEELREDVWRYKNPEK